MQAGNCPAAQRHAATRLEAGVAASSTSGRMRKGAKRAGTYAPHVHGQVRM